MTDEGEGYRVFPVDQSFSDSEVNAGRVEVRGAGYYNETRLEFNYRFEGGQEAKKEFNELFEDLDSPVDYDTVQRLYQRISEDFFGPIGDQDHRDPLGRPTGTGMSDLARRLREDTPGVSANPEQNDEEDQR